MTDRFSKSKRGVRGRFPDFPQGRQRNPDLKTGESLDTEEAVRRSHDSQPTVGKGYVVQGIRRHTVRDESGQVINEWYEPIYEPMGRPSGAPVQSKGEGNTAKSRRSQFSDLDRGVVNKKGTSQVVRDSRVDAQKDRTEKMPEEVRTPVASAETIKSVEKVYQERLRNELELGDKADYKKIEEIQERLMDLGRREFGLPSEEDDSAAKLEIRAKLQALGLSQSEDESLEEKRVEQYQEKTEWIETEARRRPESDVARMRLQRKRAREMLFGIHEEESNALSREEMTSTERAEIVKRKALIFARHQAPEGYTLTSIELPSRLDQYWEVDAQPMTIKAHYHAHMSQRGTPRAMTKEFKVDSFNLSREQRPPFRRRPVKNMPHGPLESETIIVK